MLALQALALPALVEAECIAQRADGDVALAVLQIGSGDLFAAEGEATLTLGLEDGVASWESLVMGLSLV